MKVEIDLLLAVSSKEEVEWDTPAKVRKAIYWPDGTLHSVYGLSFATGEWMQRDSSGRFPTETILDDSLRIKLVREGEDFRKEGTD